MFQANSTLYVLTFPIILPLNRSLLYPSNLPKSLSLSQRTGKKFYRHHWLDHKPWWDILNMFLLSKHSVPHNQCLCYFRSLKISDAFDASNFRFVISKRTLVPKSIHCCTNTTLKLSNWAQFEILLPKLILLKISFVTILFLAEENDGR